MYWEHENLRAIRFGNWKAIGGIGAAWELYNLETDCSEKHDVASEHPDLVKKLDQRRNKWANTQYVLPKGTMKADFSKKWNFFKTAD